MSMYLNLMPMYLNLDILDLKDYYLFPAHQCLSVHIGAKINVYMIMAIHKNNNQSFYCYFKKDYKGEYIIIKYLGTNIITQNEYYHYMRSIIEDYFQKPLNDLFDW